MDREELQRWIDAYVRLWRTEGAELGEIFAEGAVYSPGPFEEPVRGLPAIAEFWEAERLGGPDEEFELKSEVVAVEGETGVAQVEVRYGPPREQLYRDLWVVRVDDRGRCTSFEEWPFWPPGSDGTVAGAS